MLRLLLRIFRRIRLAVFTAISDYVRVRDLNDGKLLPIELKAGDLIEGMSGKGMAELRGLFPHEIVNDFVLRSQDSQGFIAYSNQIAVGYIWVSLKPRVCEGEKPFTYAVRPSHAQAYLYDLKIDPIARGRGLGAAMMSAGINWAIENGAKSILFTTGLDNQPIHQLTKLLGFKDVGIIHFKRIFGVRTVDLTALGLATTNGGTT
jgi:GNAT superfamily N-acetyltransferase